MGLDSDNWICGMGAILPDNLHTDKRIEMMKETKGILSLDDIKRLVDTFYEKVREDELIGPIFNEKILDRWP